jgi:hypothetical protein
MRAVSSALTAVEQYTGLCRLGCKRARCLPNAAACRHAKHTYGGRGVLQSGQVNGISRAAISSTTGFSSRSMEGEVGVNTLQILI